MKVKSKAVRFSLDPLHRSSMLHITYMLLQNNCKSNCVTNGLKQKKGKKRAKKLYVVE